MKDGKAISIIAAGILLASLLISPTFGAVISHAQGQNNTNGSTNQLKQVNAKNSSSGPITPIPGKTTITFLAGASVEGKPNLSPSNAQVPLGNKVVWVNKDTVPHTATSGSNASDPNSGRIFDTKIIINGQTSPPEQLKGAKAGDVIPYYCQIHPFITGKITLTAIR